MSRDVKSRLGPLALRPGWHSCPVPFTDWIGKKTEDGTLAQRPDTIWCECEVEGEQEFPEGKNGKRTLPSDWYYTVTIVIRATHKNADRNEKNNRHSGK